ncbi:MAG: protein kinase [Deltaproteobacteria bacterium]|nr:protein kinase [Deltaproteobacteria bacterium]
MKGRLFTDTSDIFSIDRGDIIQIGEKRYRVTGHERERRFGMDDPKFWVKRAVDLETGEKKILKLTFLESFETSLGGAKITCFRNPDKEARILEAVREHPHFMQGRAFRDEKENIIRVLDIVHGPNFFLYTDALEMSHQHYFENHFPVILKKLIKAFEAIRHLHHLGFKHGDIRNDHLMVENETGNYVWIDFDYDYEALENPYSLDIFGLGNVLINAVGKGFHAIEMIRKDTMVYGDLKDRLDRDDFSIIFKRRFVNLKKLYPYIPKSLNDIIMHFSIGANVYYEQVEEMLEDLNRCLYTDF